jgi:short-subunit dehydrogenase
MSENVLILGATSGIARALCRAMAKRRCRLVLAGRSSGELDRIARDLQVRYGADVFVEPFEATDFDEHARFLSRCVKRLGGDLTGAVLCYGYLPDQPTTQVDFSEARKALEVNLLSAVSILNLVANYLQQRGRGYIAAISSVAGDRGRQSNYTYGAAKAGLSAYLQGLRNRLHPAGVHVLTVKPGFVDTPMTHGLVNPDSPLVASPEQVAADNDRANRKRKDVIYTRWFWRAIMLVIGSIPERIFKRLKL